MQSVVHTVEPTLALPDLERAFLHHKVTGFPVVSDGRLVGLVGIVSTMDLVRLLAEGVLRPA